MTIERKVGMGIAGQPSGGAADVAEVFSTYLYTGTGSAQTINNGIDLAGEGGIVWIKDRGTASFSDNTVSHDGAGFMQTHATYGTSVSSQYISAFNSNGFNVGTSRSESSHDYASWTFRKKKKFFDIVTYTGNGTTLPYISQAVSHNLGSVPAMMIVKQTSGSANWVVYHKDIGNTHELVLNETGGKADSLIAWNDTTPTDTVFTVGADSNSTNKSGQTFVAYLFADNSAEDADDQMIKCGSWTETSGTVDIDLGWEPQFILHKTSSAAGNWVIFDSMRGLHPIDETDAGLTPNTSDAEANLNLLGITATGFKAQTYDGAGVEHIYMAIRAPMMVEPEAATDVFAMDTQTTGSPNYTSSFVTDSFLRSYILGSASYPMMMSRLTGTKNLITSSTAAEATTASYQWDFMDGFGDGIGGTSTDVLGYMWKRAKGYFDVVCYKGNGVGGRTQAHSLGVAPEMMWVRRRDGGGGQWMVYHTGMGNTSRVILNSASQLGSNITYWNNTSPTDSVFTVGSSSDVNASNLNFISYHFATLDGISKVGSYTGNGSNQTIDCGFSAGSRFILIRRTNVSTSNWYIWDSVRGIVAGNDPHYNLNDSTAQVTNDDSVDPHNSGFIVNQVSATNINVSSHTYIFYAIA